MSNLTETQTVEIDICIKKFNQAIKNFLVTAPRWRFRQINSLTISAHRASRTGADGFNKFVKEVRFSKEWTSAPQYALMNKMQLCILLSEFGRHFFDDVSADETKTSCNSDC